VALEHIDPYPWFLNKWLDISVNDLHVRARISASEWADAWRPLMARIHDMWLAHYPKRFLVAIAGPPGAGKSVFAEELHFIIDKGILHKEAHTVSPLPMDGFHFSNAYLQEHTRKLPDGKEILLSSVKGAPDTIDVVRLRRYMSALVGRPEFVPWPGYSRNIHDVVPDKFKVHESVNLVIIEGNYLLVNRGGFMGLPEMFNLRIYVDAPAPKIIANLVDRHIKGGKSLEEAKEWVKRIDLPNARVAESSRQMADVVIERDTDDDISSITWKGEAPITSSKEGPSGQGVQDVGGAVPAVIVPPAIAPHPAAPSPILPPPMIP
jgi:pantothenate kinase